MSALLATRRAAAALILAPGYGRCRHCHMPWNRVKNHSIEYSDTSALFFVCEWCWPRTTTQERTEYLGWLLDRHERRRTARHRSRRHTETRRQRSTGEHMTPAPHWHVEAYRGYGPGEVITSTHLPCGTKLTTCRGAMRAQELRTEHSKSCVEPESAPWRCRKVDCLDCYEEGLT